MIISKVDKASATETVDSGLISSKIKNQTLEKLVSQLSCHDVQH